MEILLVSDVMDLTIVPVPDESTIYIDSRAPLRVAVYRMAETGTKQLAVTNHDEPDDVVGLVTVEHLLKARVANLDAENRRERHLQLWGTT